MVPVLRQLYTEYGGKYIPTILLLNENLHIYNHKLINVRYSVLNMYVQIGKAIKNQGQNLN